MNSKQRFESACRNNHVDRPPVWMMRQAGRTLKEYKAVREKHSFWEICKTPELATLVTLQPVQRFPIDAAIIFSDILVIPDTMGMDVQFSPKLTLAPRIQTMSDVKGLKTPDPGKTLKYVAETIQSVIKEKNNEIAVIGFSGAPLTVASYMIEGGSSSTFHNVRKMMHQDPSVFHALMEKVSKMVTDYLLMQLESQVSAVQLFDTWASELSADDYRQFVLPYVTRIIENLKPKNIPIIYYVNGIGNLLDEAKHTGADVLGIDWRIKLSDVRKKCGNDTVVQGNLDPTVLYSPETEIRKRVNQMIEQTNGVGHIVNLGHGLIPDIPIGGIEAFVNAVVNWGKNP